MKVFMLGWEFPPHISGGLGTACYGMTKGLDEIGVGVCFVLPTAVPVDTSSHVKLRTPSDVAKSLKESDVETFEHVTVRSVEAALQPYASPVEYEEVIRRIETQRKADKQIGPSKDFESAMEELPPLPSGSFVPGGGAHYGRDLMGQVNHYARLALEISKQEEFDVIHAHDWMTYPAGLAVSAASGKPLVVHVHSTEFDRSGENINQQVYDVERMGMHGARCVICVSHLTKNIVTSRYGVDPDHVEVVYNAVNLPNHGDWDMPPIKHDEKIVLFLGRVTMQKGPEYFLLAAKKVLEKMDNVRFVMAGSGDMIAQCVHLVADLKLGRHVTFTGFLRGSDVDRIFSMADLYVMPSVSEPFGIAPLEALSHNVPVIISKQSGVSEVLSHALKVDFWDIEEMANQILAVLRHKPLRSTLRQHGQIECRKLSWLDSAKQLNRIYKRLTKAG